MAIVRSRTPAGSAGPCNIQSSTSSGIGESPALIRQGDPVPGRTGYGREDPLRVDVAAAGPLEGPAFVGLQLVMVMAQEGQVARK